LTALLALAACEGPQSVLDPAGPSASSINRLGITMYVAASLVVLLVGALMLVPFIRRRERTVNRGLFLWGGGVALPLLVLTGLVPYAMTTGHDMRAALPASALSVDVTGSRWWWQMAYRRAGRVTTTANELYLPAGEPVEVRLVANDVIHSFWAPNLAGKMDLIPGRVNRMVIQADRPGVYRGQCAEYCGLQHALMAFDVVALPRDEFDAWLDKLAAPAPEPATAQLREGRDLFVQQGCGTCHTVRGVSNGRTAPDLTLVGARRMIGAGALGGGTGNIAGWIAGTQHLKPGNAMPPYRNLEGPALRALAAWLGSLR
jgi:cytochrome c oxidase subunit 2